MIPEEMKNCIGLVDPPTIYEVEKGAVRRYAEAVGDDNPLYSDEKYAAKSKYGGIIAHGMLKHAWLIQFVTGWMGDQGFMKKFSCQFRGMDRPRRMKTMDQPHNGETWHCKGRVVKKHIDGNDHCVDLDIGIENGEGKVTTPGTATVILPLRN